MLNQIMLMTILTLIGVVPIDIISSIPNSPTNNESSPSEMSEAVINDDQNKLGVYVAPNRTDTIPVIVQAFHQTIDVIAKMPITPGPAEKSFSPAKCSKLSGHSANIFELVMLRTILLVAALISGNLGASTPSGNGTSSTEESSVATNNGSDNQPGSTSMAKLDPLDSVFILFLRIDDLLDDVFQILEDILSPITLPISFLLKALLTPVIFILRVLLLVVEILLTLLLRGLVTFVLGPILTVLGLGDLVPAINSILDVVDLLLDRVSCLLGLLGFFSGLLPGCSGKSAMEVWSSDINENALAVYQSDVASRCI
ncbi:uncharacterized protein LOC135161451 [Diachasmimorpha longicaudata]|uniref:uncharacterized protein LOC135161451 n=1 Tax=Diachasmimorpha longicaudata TaxID=58733 RepID=UPI0030B88014